jgi:hypothetical protein
MKTRLCFDPDKPGIAQLLIKLHRELEEAGVHFTGDLEYEYDENDVELNNRIRKIYDDNYPKGISLENLINKD